MERYIGDKKEYLKQSKLMKNIILIGGGLIGYIYDFLTNHSNTEFDVILFEKKRLPKIEKTTHNL